MENYSLSTISDLIDPNWESYNICNEFTNFSFKWKEPESSAETFIEQHHTDIPPMMELNIDNEPQEDDNTYDSFTHLAENVDVEEYKADIGCNDDELDLISKILGDVGSIVPGL